MPKAKLNSNDEIIRSDNIASEADNLNNYSEDLIQLAKQ